MSFADPPVRIGQFPISANPPTSTYLAGSNLVFDPNPSNNQTAPLLTVGPAEVSLFGDRDARIALLLALGMLLAVAAWHQLREAR